MVGISFEYIKTLEIFKECRRLLAEFTGLDVEIFTLDDQGIWFPCSLKSKPQASCSKWQKADCNKISPDILNDVLLNKKVRLFFCPSGMTKIVVPLFFSGEIAALFFVGEKGVSQMDGKKLDALSKFIYQIGNYVVENESTFLRHFKGNGSSYKQDLFGRIEKYLWNSNNRGKLTLRDLARENGISYWYLSRLFKDGLQMNFVEYRKRMKMYLAAKLLTDRRLTVDQVSQACGFYDLSYFCKSFRKVFGCTAGNFRRRYVAGRKKSSVDELIERRTLKNGGRLLSGARNNNLLWPSDSNLDFGIEKLVCQMHGK